MYYLLKIKGTAKIPDYIQLRDKSFTLIAYFRADRPERALEKCGLEKYQNTILKLANNISFGKVEQFSL